MDDNFNNREEEPETQEDPTSEIHANQNAPEPPNRWNPDDPNFKPVTIEEAFEQANVTTKASIGKTAFTLKGAEIPQFQSARRFMIISQVVAGVSLFFGGVILSALAVLLAFMARDRFNRIAAAKPDDLEAQQALTRSGTIAIVITIGVLILNIIALIYLYPIVADSIQSGNFNFLGGGTGTSGTGTTSGTWG